MRYVYYVCAAVSAAFCVSLNNFFTCRRNVAPLATGLRELAAAL